MKPTKHKYTVLKQICRCIPPHLVPKFARSFGADKKARSFSPWSHAVAMLHVHLAHSRSLNDVADALRNHAGVLTTVGRDEQVIRAYIQRPEAEDRRID